MAGTLLDLAAKIEGAKLPAAEHDMRGRLATVDAAKEFVLAGNARITLRSKKTGTRYTYRIKKADDKNRFGSDRWFVALLTGADNENDFSYIGILDERANSWGTSYVFKTTANSKLGERDAPVVAFNFFAGMVLNKRTMPNSLEVWHEGRCGRCARTLTVPESVEKGIGPECLKHMGGH